MYVSITLHNQRGVTVITTNYAHEVLVILQGILYESDLVHSIIWDCDSKSDFSEYLGIHEFMRRDVIIFYIKICGLLF